MIPYGLQQVPGNPHTSDTSCLKDGPNRPMGSAHETSASCTRVSEQPWGEVKLKGYSLSRVQLFVTPWTGARQAPLSMAFCRHWSV